MTSNVYELDNIRMSSLWAQIIFQWFQCWPCVEKLEAEMWLTHIFLHHAYKVYGPTPVFTIHIITQVWLSDK